MPGTFGSPYLGCFAFLALEYCSHLRMVWVADGQGSSALLEVLKVPCSLMFGLTIVGVSGSAPCP